MELNKVLNLQHKTNTNNKLAKKHGYTNYKQNSIVVCHESLTKNQAKNVNK